MQQINLYNKSLRKKILSFSLYRLSQGSLALLVFFGLWYSINEYQFYSLQTQISDAKILLVKKQKQLQTFQASLPKVKKDLSLKAKLTRIEQDLINKQAVLDVLSDQKLGNTSGFTGHFEGLARQTIKGLWLTKLYFMQGGTAVNIHGYSKQPELLPQYLQALSSEDAFKGTEFNYFIIQRDKKSKALSFMLNNINTGTPESQTELASQ